jgi:hypothetical protein
VEEARKMTPIMTRAGNQRNTSEGFLVTGRILTPR